MPPRGGEEKKKVPVSKTRETDSAPTVGQKYRGNRFVFNLSWKRTPKGIVAKRGAAFMGGWNTKKDVVGPISSLALTEQSVEWTYLRCHGRKKVHEKGKEKETDKRKRGLAGQGGAITGRGKSQGGA